MKSSTFLAIAAIACLFISVQSAAVISQQCPAKTENQTVDWTNCTYCNWNTVTDAANVTTLINITCAQAGPGYYLTYNTNGLTNLVQCPASLNTCSLRGTNWLTGTSNTTQYISNIPACGANTSATNIQYTGCTQNGALTCDTRGEIASCSNNTYFYQAIPGVYFGQRSKCAPLDTSKATSTNGGVLTILKGSYCVGIQQTQNITCYSCPANGTCDSQTWEPEEYVDASPIQCATGTYLSWVQSNWTLSCSACPANAECLYGYARCNPNFYPNQNNVTGITTCNACPTVGQNGVNSCDSVQGIQCCSGYFLSYDGVTCKSCPTADIWGMFTEAYVDQCTPARKTCVNNAQLYKDKCYPNFYQFSMSSSVLTYTSMMIVAVILALF